LKKYRFREIVVFLLLIIIHGTKIFSEPMVGLRFKIGYDSFEMNDMKKIQRDYVQYFSYHDISVKTITSFPPYFGYSVGLLYGIKKPDGLPIFWGITAGFNSTGSRANYGDYSGTIGFDQTVTATYAGLTNETTVSSIGKMHISIDINALVLQSHLTMTERSGNEEHMEEETYRFESVSFGFQPDVALNIPIGINFLKFSLGYLIYPPKSVHLKGHKKATLRLDEDEDATLGWSGLRIGVSYTLLYNYKK